MSRADLVLSGTDVGLLLAEAGADPMLPLADTEQATGLEPALPVGLWTRWYTKKSKGTVRTISCQPRRPPKDYSISLRWERRDARRRNDSWGRHRDRCTFMGNHHSSFTPGMPMPDPKEEAKVYANHLTSAASLIDMLFPPAEIKGAVREVEIILKYREDEERTPDQYRKPGWQGMMSRQDLLDELGTGGGLFNIGQSSEYSWRTLRLTAPMPTDGGVR